MTVYLDHFGLRLPPFALTPDTSFFFEYGHFRDALNTLVVALRSGEGFIKVTGEVGTGKTLLCRKLLNTLDQEFYTAYVPNPFLSPEALNLAFAEELGLELPRELGQHRIIKEVTRKLIELHNKGTPVVLCIDEAQALPEETLESLRLLTNIETERRKLLQVVLFGQPELDSHLAKRSVRQLRQRITFSQRLDPIDFRGMEAYISHRLLVAGSHGNIVFEQRALERIFRASGGIPRLVNVLCHKALMACYGEGSNSVTARHAELAIADTEDARSRRSRVWIAGSILAAAAAAGAAWTLFFGHL